MIERDGNRLRVKGALNFANAAALSEAARQHFSGDVVIDFGGVTEVDSAALSLLFEWRRAARRSNCRLTFENLPASLQTLAALYGVTDLVAAGA